MDAARRTPMQPARQTPWRRFPWLTALLLGALLAGLATPGRLEARAPASARVAHGVVAPSLADA